MIDVDGNGHGRKSIRGVGAGYAPGPRYPDPTTMTISECRWIFVTCLVGRFGRYVWMVFLAWPEPSMYRMVPCLCRPAGGAVTGRTSNPALARKAATLWALPPELAP